MKGVEGLARREILPDLSLRRLGMHQVGSQTKLFQGREIQIRGADGKGESKAQPKWSELNIAVGGAV